MAAAVQLLDTTLRDGSYEIAFQFSPEDVALLVGALDAAGVSYIELCHGNGFGFDRWRNWPEPRRHRAALSDEAYLDVASSVVKNAQLGVVYVVEPQFLTLDDLALVPKHGAKFVRLMFLPTNIGDNDALIHIDRAKSLGLTVSVNLTQTYALSIKEVVTGAIECKRRGTDWFYIVDSAGGMAPAEVASYVRAVMEATGLRVGLHAHNNSGLAVANCLAAIEAGATLVDGTLQGVGRNTGNPATEQLLLALQRLGHEAHIDRELVYNMGDLIRTVLVEKGNDPTDYVFGAVKLPWRQVPKLLKLAAERGRAPREFLRRVGLELGKRHLILPRSYPADLLDEVSAATPGVDDLVPSDAIVAALAAGITRVSTSRLGGICDELCERGSKRDKRAVLHLVPTSAIAYAHPLPWPSDDAEYVGVTIASDDWASVAPDRFPPLILADPTVELPELPATTRVYREQFARLEASALADVVHAAARTVVVLGSLSERLRHALSDFTLGTTRSGATLFVVEGALSDEQLAQAQSGDLVLLVGGHAVSPARITNARGLGIRLLRPPIAAAAGARISALERATAMLVGADTAQLGALTLTSPTAVSAPGEVVVDNLAAPTRIVDSGTRTVADVARVLAHARATSLYRGRGTL